MLRNLRFTALVKTVMVICLILITMETASSAVRIRGSLGIRSYGYQDASGEDHIWLLQSTRFSVTNLKLPLSIHFSGGYIGDNQDDFSASGRGRFLKGYLQYGKIGGEMKARFGRFFLYRGIAVGVLDGLDVEKRFGKSLKLSLFAGLMAPISRDFEFEYPADALSGGGELRWNPRKLWRFQASSFALSYTRQTRDDKAYRNRLGLTGYVRYNNHLTAYTFLHLRPTASPLKRLTGRIRCTKENWDGMFEAGIRSVDISEYSWFSDFKHTSYQRIRMSFNHYRVPRKWGCGVEGAMLIAGSETGFRIGPSIITPFGRAGYRKQFGNQASADGPWVSIRYTPFEGLETYIDGSRITYEWDAFDVESDDLSMLQTGLRYMPAFRKDMTLSLEYQVYQSPQFTNDRRFMGGIRWNFDHGRKG